MVGEHSARSRSSPFRANARNAREPAPALMRQGRVRSRRMTRRRSFAVRGVGGHRGLPTRGMVDGAALLPLPSPRGTTGWPARSRTMSVKQSCRQCFRDMSWALGEAGASPPGHGPVYASTTVTAASDTLHGHRRQRVFDGARLSAVRHDEHANGVLARQSGDEDRHRGLRARPDDAERFEPCASASGNGTSLIRRPQASIHLVVPRRRPRTARHD